MFILTLSIAFADPIEELQEENDTLRLVVSALQQESNALREESSYLREALEERKSQVVELDYVIRAQAANIRSLGLSLTEQEKKTFLAENLASEFETLYLSELEKPKPVMPLERVAWITGATALFGTTVFFYAKSTQNKVVLLNGQ